MNKICFVTTVSMTLKIFVIDTAKYLHDSGEFDISFICNNDEEFFASLPEYIHYYPVDMVRGIDLGAIKAVATIAKIFKREKFDIVQYSTPNAACYASIASWVTRVPVRLYCQWGVAYVGFSGVKRKIFKTIEKFVCFLSTKIEPDSFGNLKFSMDEGLYKQSKGLVVWNGSASGVNLQKFDITKKMEWRRDKRSELLIPDDAIVYIFVGRVTKDKGVNELFAATRKLMGCTDNAYLLLVGPNEKANTIEMELLKWSKNESRVINCGFTDVVEQYLAASDVYVLPSYREGFGSAVVEAEAMGIPVIVTDIQGPTDAMQKDVTGIIVQKKSKQQLYNAMKILYKDQKQRENLGAAGVKFVTEKFNQKILFEKILENRKQLLE